MIQVNNVSKDFLVKKVLKQCSITFEAGKITGVIGENGSGKTTLLKLLAGLLKPSKGEIIIGSVCSNRRISRVVAYLTEKDYFYPYFTIGEIIFYYETQFIDFDKEKAYTIMSFMGLQNNEKIKYLSKGNLSRLKIALTLARNAPYIILDEPFSGLDPLVRKAIINGIIKFIDLNNQTLILTTHELREVEPILDNVVLLRDGKIIAHESVDHIREKYALNVFDWFEKTYQQKEGKICCNNLTKQN